MYLIHEELDLKEVPSSSISTENMQIAAVLQPSASGTKVVRVTYLQISAEKKAKIAKCGAEHGVLVTIWYYTTKLPVLLTNSGLGIEQRAFTILFLQNFKRAIWEILDQQNVLYGICTMNNR